MWFHVFVILELLMALFKNVSARFCEGGHICSLPRECCTQGCCPPYQGGPRQLPPPSEHVLNLFFISHWFFWCVVVAVILAILCAYSLWKKRRTLCGWGFTEHHPQSEGDSAGSCYAPPQYSRCNSFHHPPPPYTEVTSKPDLYPLVFTCNSDNGKNGGSSYLMVQYFRNYIVRPAGSLSAASTVDSLSSSFICNANEANTLVPPPYSRAASPELHYGGSGGAHYQQHLTHGQLHQQQQHQQSPLQFQHQQHHQHQHHQHHAQQYMLPRSASQLVCVQQDYHAGPGGAVNLATQQVYQQRPGATTTHYATVTVNGLGPSQAFHTRPLPTSESGTFTQDDSGESSRSGSRLGSTGPAHQSGVFIQSQSDQHFRYSNSSISDIFVNNSCTAGIGGASGATAASASATSGGSHEHSRADEASLASLAIGGTPVIFSNGCIKPNPLHRANTNPTQFTDGAQAAQAEAVYNSCNSIGGISITVPVNTTASTTTAAGSDDNEFMDLQLLRRSLETCCHMLQQQQPPPTSQELAKKFTEDASGLRSYVTSGTVSGVSSLANIGTPTSPPQATSPTGEVKEILDQIRQLQAGVSYEELMASVNTSTATASFNKPKLHHTLSSPTPPTTNASGAKSKFKQTNSIEPPASPASLQRYANVSVAGEKTKNLGESFTNNPSVVQRSSMGQRPSNLQQSQSQASSKLSKSKLYTTSSKPNKALYIPMVTSGPGGGSTNPPANRCVLKSPVSSVVGGASFFVNRGRSRIGWISRSAPTTPGTGLPPNRLGDDSPLLHEHDEDAEGEQNAELE